jgi:molybdopterin-containing oxidoreductase family iron-sulfur binding subunit
MAACPYHVRQFNWWDPVWPDGMERALNPDVSVRMRGVVEKCSFCYHRYQRALDQAYHAGRREIAEGEYQTACTQACPAKAITFGDLNNPQHAVHRMVRPDPAHGGRPQEPKAFRLLERLGTNPKVYYLSSKEWVRKSGDNEVRRSEKGA